MKIKNPFKQLNKFDIVLWCVSLAIVTVAFLVPKEKDWLVLVTSLIGVTTLVFEAKGNVFGHFLTLAFSVVYGIITFRLQYYGEMITRLGMAAPLAVLAIVSWLRHPYKDTQQVKVGKITKIHVIIMCILTPAVAVSFYFILKAIGTANLIFSTVSVSLSFLANYLMFIRSPWYALGFVASDGSILVLWILKTVESIVNLPMVICFGVFILIDVYGFFNWRKMQRKQNEEDGSDNCTGIEPQ